jgi:DNA-binding beta-propeller fold protein YncE
MIQASRIALAVSAAVVFLALPGTGSKGGRSASLGVHAGAASSPCSRTHLTHPTFVAVDRHGSVYVADCGYSIFKLSSSGKILRRWGEPVRGHYVLQAGHFAQLNGIAVDSSGDVYAVDAATDSIQQFSPAGKVLGVWGGEGWRMGQFRAPAGVAVDRRGNLYVADAGNRRVQELHLGAPLASFGSGAAVAGRLVNPRGVGVDAQADVYVADAGTGDVVKFSHTGKFLARWGPGGRARRGLFGAYDLTVDGRGNVFVVQRCRRGRRWACVVKLSPEGRVLSLWGKSARGLGILGRPAGIAVDSRGRIYVTDAERGHVLQLSPKGTVLAVWR